MHLTLMHADLDSAGEAALLSHSTGTSGSGSGSSGRSLAGVLSDVVGPAAHPRFAHGPAGTGVGARDRRRLLWDQRGSGGTGTGSSARVHAHRYPLVAPGEYPARGVRAAGAASAAGAAAAAGDCGDDSLRLA